MSRMIVNLAAAAIVLAGATAAHAQQFPTKPLRLVIGFGVGGVTDVIARTVGDEMGKALGQPVVVENRTGAGGLLAAQTVKRADPDGYTLFSGSVSTFAPVMAKDGIHAPTELLPISLTAVGDWMFYIRGQMPVKTLPELAAWAKANPGKLTFASVSPVNQALVSLLGKKAGFTFETVPYRTSDQIVGAMLNNDAQITFNALSGYQAHVQSGSIRILSTLGEKRSPLTPDAPTAKEQGVDFATFYSQGIWAPLGTPPAVVARLQAAVAEAVKSAKFTEVSKNAAMENRASTAAELVRISEDELKVYAEATKLIGYVPQ
jgi:tripartite-type tricarboxylate transporter receptor subunit TctC